MLSTDDAFENKQNAQVLTLQITTRCLIGM